MMFLSEHKPGNMLKLGILIILLLFGGCFPFVFSRRKRQRNRAAEKKRIEDGERTPSGVSNGQTPYKLQEHTVPENNKKKQTGTCLSRASRFTGPQDLSEEDKLWLQAYRFGLR